MWNVDQTISLEDYIAKMPAGQTKIFYVTADTFNAASHSPHLEIFRKKGIEVLLLTDSVDEWLMMHLTKFQDKPVQEAVTRGGLDLGDLADKTAEEHYKQAEMDFEETVKKVKELLQPSVKDVRLSQRCIRRTRLEWSNGLDVVCFGATGFSTETYFRIKSWTKR